MSKLDKLIEEIKTLPNDLRFAELEKILESMGYHMESPHGGSSHCTFRKKGKTPITIPKHNPIKTVYVKMVKEIIEDEENTQQNT